MKELNFSDCKKTGNITYDFLQAVRECKKSGVNKLIIPKDTYVLDSVFCEQRILNISNHGLNGPKRIGILVDGMSNFEIDFCGSTLTTKDEIIPIAILNSKNVKISNVFIDNPKTKTLEMKVVETSDDVIKVKTSTDKSQFFICGGKIWGSYGREYLYLKQGGEIEFNGTTGEIEYGTGDSCLGAYSDITYEDIGDGYYLIRGFKRIPPIGNIIITNTYCRCACGVLVDGCEDVTLKDVTIHACFGMGLLAQFTNNITLNSFNVLRKKGRYYSSNADATHFVCCTGLVKVENGTFAGQLDDALNIHGVYVRIIDKLNDKEALIKQMHCQATGLKIFKKGDIVNIVDVETLLPYSKKTVDAVEIINDEIMKVTFKEDLADVKVGDDIENVTKSPSLIFRKNIVRDNRARGMLIACKGETIIEENYFHTAGASILFESDGQYWFESGGTRNVIIRNNFFDRCKHGTWGSSVIQFAKRKKTKDGEFYHGVVKIYGNKFDIYDSNIAELDNIATVEFKDNVIENGTGRVTLTHYGRTEIKNNDVEVIQ